MGDQNDEIVGVKSLFTYNEKMTLLVIIYEQEGSILPFVNTEFNSQSSIRCHFHGLSDDVHCQIPETKKSSTCFSLLIYNCFKMTACICFEPILQNFFFPFPFNHCWRCGRGVFPGTATSNDDQQSFVIAHSE